MASKRKSTVPCMIPSKSKHMREDIILGCLPELLPTIPEDSILSISSKDEETRFHDFSKAEPKTSCWERGTYSCPLCCFESGDLNLFLHHMDNCHMDFHAQPNFYCLSCKVSAVKFEGLALHNAKSHPELHSVHKRVSLQVTKRDGAITVEQTLFTEADLSESGISITKTPIMKITKGGHKKIVVSHTVEVQRAEPSIDKPATVTNGTSVRTLPLTTSSHIIGGIIASPVHKIPNALGIPGMHNRGPLWNSNPSSPDSNADLPKVMIPLSSIPTYDPAMDLSSFLKTSFGKFPYPTKAELCYLTVVSGFPEEQIKLWFTAQRLKQGISWSPEEIEDTRRKMFNTVFQATPKTSRNQSHHPFSQHCVSVQSASLISNSTQQIPKGSVMGWKGGVIVSQSSVTKATSLKQQQQPVVQTPQVNIHHAVITKETGKELSCRTAENCKIAGRGGSVSNHGHTGKGCSSSIKTSVSCLPGVPKSQNSSYIEGSIMTLTNIVSKIDCHVNDRNANCSSKSNISPTSIHGQQKASSNAKENGNSSFATTSKYNNGSTYKSTSHSTICTKSERNILDHTSKSNTDTSVICSSSSNIQTEKFIPPLTHSLFPQPGSLMDPSLRKGKVLPEQPVTLKQSFIHNSFPEQKQLLAPQGQPYHIRTLTDSQSAVGGSFSNLPQSSLQSNPAASSCLQEETSQHSLSAPQEQHSPKTLLGAPQVQSTGSTAVHYKEHDPKHLLALDKDSKQSNFDNERLHRNITQKENEVSVSEHHSGLTNTFYKADSNEHSNLINTLDTFTNNNTNKAKQGMPLLQQYIQKVDQWESNSDYHEESNVIPMKINVIALNKEESLYKTNSKQQISKSLENLINDGGPSHKNKSSEWLESYQHVPVEAEERISDIGNTEPHQPDNLVGLETEQVKHDLHPERKIIFQSLDSETPTLPIKNKSKEATVDLDKSTAGEQDYWEIKDEEHQQPMGNQSLRGHQAQDSQSRDCLRGELLKV
ncbi:zinc fingers and homeoboxes protein 1-like [Sinocyclocheilus grahami]|uniref:zinc fingers and homeoboxes protein 1-like n=1 Tax=Sinocyclocheilus grahami TaxID=75366 RepID=UPI0007ACF2F9|nr:PREDICTED: zinc fingers and homeoboxes protein 1-like [Sinocyclocheilus grahami]